ncbi:MAG: hypothetical protein AB1861_10420 [Cyanobacteriota bacterium]
MAKLHLKSITCYDTQEWPQDELYLKVDGKQVWSQGGVGVGDTFNINKTIDITGSSDKIQLFEDDWWPNQDEHLGNYTVSAWEAGLPEWTATFNLAGADYSLVYEVY